MRAQKRMRCALAAHANCKASGFFPSLEFLVHAHVTMFRDFQKQKAPSGFEEQVRLISLALSDLESAGAVTVLLAFLHPIPLGASRGKIAGVCLAAFRVG